MDDEILSLTQVSGTLPVTLTKSLVNQGGENGGALMGPSAPRFLQIPLVLLAWCFFLPQACCGAPHHD